MRAVKPRPPNRGVAEPTRPNVGPVDVIAVHGHGDQVLRTSDEVLVDTSAVAIRSPDRSGEVVRPVDGILSRASRSSPGQWNKHREGLLSSDTLQMAADRTIMSLIGIS